MEVGCVELEVGVQEMEEVVEVGWTFLISMLGHSL